MRRVRFIKSARDTPSKREGQLDSIAYVILSSRRPRRQACACCVELCREKKASFKSGGQV